MAIIVILGAGMMGSALAVPLADRGHEVRLVGTHLDGEIIERLRKDHVHVKLGCELPHDVQPYSIDELAAAMQECDLVALGVNSHGVRWAAKRLTPFVEVGMRIVMVTKGLEWDEGGFSILPDVLARRLPERVRGAIHPVGITGPCIAGELARRAETCVVLAGRDSDARESFAEAMSTEYYHLWTSGDAVGHEACAALKNAYAMGIGFGAGLHERRGGKPGSVALHNYESAVFAQAVLETQLLVEIAGGRRETTMGLSGVGDLDVTTNGGRTGRFGRWLGRGLTVDEAIEKMAGATLECLDVVRVVDGALGTLETQGKLAEDDLPLMRHMADVVLRGAPVDVPFGDFFRTRGGT